MKLTYAALAIAALHLTGCYNLVIVNVGVGNKSAAASAAPFDLEAYCAALTGQPFVISGQKGTQITSQAVKMCNAIAARKGTQ
jgi:hypothetical protein